MKESLFDILNSHPNWEENHIEPATSIEVRATLLTACYNWETDGKRRLSMT